MKYDFSRADQVVRQGLKDGAYTAACLLVGQKEKVLFRRAYGRLSADEEAPRVNEQTRFDLDSLTKPLVTGMLALRALEAGKLCLNDTLGTFIHAPQDKAEITIAQLMCHTSGLNAQTNLSAQEAAQIILNTPLTAMPGQKVEYGNAGYILLGQLLECLYGMELSELAVQEVFWPLKMLRTGYLPKDGNIAATEMQENGRCLQGEAYDENSRSFAGVSGHAGVFGTMDDLALWMQMIAAEGALPDGSQYLSRHTIRMLMKELASGRGLCFALPDADGFTGDLFPSGTIGHTGFTGCSAAFDPSEGVYVIFLTNRICPSRDNPAIHRIRRLLHNAIYAAV